MTQQEQYAIRDMYDAEADQLWRLFHATVRSVNLADYSPQQVAAWSPENRDMDQWRVRMAEIAPFVALSGDQIVGYSDLQSDGLIDHLFVHKDWQGQGVARALMNEVFRRAKARGIRELHAFVSITARPVFEGYGFFVERENSVDMDGTVLTNYVMRRSL